MTSLFSLEQKHQENWWPPSSVKNTKKTMTSLFSLEEKRHESLRDFLRRLNEAGLQIEDYLSNITLVMLMSNVRNIHVRLSIENAGK